MKHWTDEINLSDLFTADEPDGPKSSSGSSALVSLEDIFAEEPVSLDVFVQDKKFMNNPPLGPKQYDAVKHIERIYLPVTYPLMKKIWPYWSKPVRMINTATLQWGKGGGKDHICRVSSLRIAYLLLCLKDPQGYFEIPEQDTIHLLNIASSSQQAERAFFTPMTRVAKKGWFSDKCDSKQNSIVYNKNIEAISGHSDAEGQEGLNLILGVADEIDAFKSKEETEKFRGNAVRDSSRSAESILEMLHTSASTRFPESYKNVRISYPRYLGSTIQRLTEEGVANIAEQGRESRVFVSGPYKTWEVNPRYDRFERIVVPNADTPIPNAQAFIDDYKSDPDLARAKYECRPSRAIDTYFKNMQAFRSCVTSPTQPLEIDYTLKALRSSVTGEKADTWDANFTFAPDFFPQTGANYVIHADLAIKGDRAGIAMAHVVRYESVIRTSLDEEGAESSQELMLPVVKVDFIVGFSASTEVTPAREIQIRWVRQLIFELIRRGFHISFVSYDGYQSTDSMQILESHGIETDRKSTDLREEFWKSLRDVAYEGRLEMPFSQILLTEIESLGRFGNKIDHPAHGSKDYADAVAVACSTAIEAGGEEFGERAYAGDARFVLGKSTKFEGYELVGSPFSYDTQILGESPIFGAW